MSLKSTEVENWSQIIRAILISSFGSSSCSQPSCPSIIRPNYVFVNDDFKDEILSCRIQLLHRLLAVTFDCGEEDWSLSSRDRTQREFVLMAQCRSIFFRCIGMVAVVPTSSLGWGFALCLWPGCNHTFVLVCRICSSCGSAGISVLSWIESITYLTVP